MFTGLFSLPWWGYIILILAFMSLSQTLVRINMGMPNLRP